MCVATSALPLLSSFFLISSSTSSVVLYSCNTNHTLFCDKIHYQHNSIIWYCTAVTDIVIIAYMRMFHWVNSSFSQLLEKPQLRTGCWLPCCSHKPLQSRLFLINTLLGDRHTVSTSQDSIFWPTGSRQIAPSFSQRGTLLCAQCKDQNEFSGISKVLCVMFES